MEELFVKLIEKDPELKQALKNKMLAAIESSQFSEQFIEKLEESMLNWIDDIEIPDEIYNAIRDWVSKTLTERIKIKK
jgi:hypothetical protein